MSKTPPIPKEQRSFSGQGRPEPDHEAHANRDTNLKTQGDAGNIRQNLTPQRKTQDR